MNCFCLLLVAGVKIESSYLHPIGGPRQRWVFLGKVPGRAESDLHQQLSLHHPCCRSCDQVLQLSQLVLHNGTTIFAYAIIRQET